MARRSFGIGAALSLCMCLCTSAQPWREVAKLTPLVGGGVDYFGESVAINGSTAIVGAPYDDDQGERSGAAYIFENIAGTWTQVARLAPSDAAPNLQFGISVAISGDTAIVGTSPFFIRVPGSAYVFQRTAGVWSQIARLSTEVVHDNFGASVAITDGIVVVGAPGDLGEITGSAYIFQPVDGSWVQVSKLAASDTMPGTLFGGRVAIGDGTVVVGAQGDTDLGAAYVFRLVAGSWTQAAKLTAGDGQAGDSFGSAVATTGEVAIVGAYLDADRGFGTGSAYVFKSVEGSWSQVAKLTAVDGVSSDWFGASVALDGGTAIVGAYGKSYRGAAYIYTDFGGSWVQTAKLTVRDSEYSNYFGASVALSADTALVGMLFGGPVYAFQPLPCAPDCDSNERLDVNDFLCFQVQWRERTRYGDYNGDGLWLPDDFLAFQADWLATCR